MKYFKQAIAILALGTALSAGTAFFYQTEHVVAAEKQAPAAPPPSMPVVTDKIQPQAVQIWKPFSGRVVAVDRAEIRPQVSGRIMEVRFENGQHVEKGDVLFVIDPRPYEAALNQAKASLQAAKARADLAEKEYQRAKSLIKTEAISQSLLDERANNRDSAAADVLGAKAAVESAQINMDYAYVKAPISGKVSRAEITQGNLVQAANAPLLTSIVADQNVYVDFEVDDKTYLTLVRGHKDGDLSDVPIKLSLPGGNEEYQGKVQSFDNKIDATTGTIRARALFENKDGILLPGMSVGVNMGVADGQKHILVSERAIGTDQDRKFVYVISDQGTAAYREIKIGDSVNGQRIVLAGLSEGDNVITEGIMHIRPNMPVVKQIQTPAAPENQSEQNAQNKSKGQE